MTIPMRDMSPAEREVTHEYFRKRRLPEMIAAARRKVAALENEARRYGMSELLTNPEHVNAAWDREVTIAYSQNLEGEEGNNAA